MEDRLRRLLALTIYCTAALAHAQPAPAPDDAALDDAALGEAALTLTQVVRQAVSADPRAQAAGVRLSELQSSAFAAQGAFDLVGDLSIDATSERLTARDETGRKIPLDTTRVTVDASIIQPLVWGTQLSAGWTNRFTETDNPFRNCVPGVASDQCFESRLSLSIMQPLLRGRGRAINEIAATRVDAESRVARAQQVATVAGLIEQVVITCAELAFAEGEVAIQTRALALAEAQRDFSRKQIRGRRMAPVEIAVVEQAVAERAQSVFVAEQRVAERSAELALRLGQDALPPIALPPPEGWADDAPTTRARVAAAHPELQVAEARLEAQRQEMVVRTDAVRPQLDVSVVAAQTGIDEDISGAVAALPDNEGSFYGATLAFRFPFANRRAEGELAAARRAVDRAGLERDGQARDVRLAADAAVRALRTAEQAERLAARVVELSERSLDAEQKRLKLGRATNLDVLRVQQQVAAAALSVVRAQTDARIARARLDRLTGVSLARFGIDL
ncbi:MAG: outer membrane protein [Bradymonadia bacterium]